MQPLTLCSILSLFFASATSLALSNHLSLVNPQNLENGSQPLGSSNITNLTGSSDPHFHPYVYHVPETDIYLHLGFGVFGKTPVNPIEMEHIINLAQTEVDLHIQNEGLDLPIPTARDQRQRWQISLPAKNGRRLEFSIKSFLAHPMIKVTWKHVAEVLRGLREFLVEGQRFWATSFKIVRKKHWYDQDLIASGKIRLVAASSDGK